MKRQRRAHRRKYLFRESASINGSYDFVPQSYDLASRRLDSIERRINNSLIFFVTATFAIGGALLAVAPEPENIVFRHHYFVLAVAMFVIAVLMGILSNLDDDRLAFINPQILYEENRSDTTLEFRKKIVEASGQHFATNRSTITKKRNFLMGMNLVFVLELLFGYLWLQTIFGL